MRARQEEVQQVSQRGSVVLSRLTYIFLDRGKLLLPCNVLKQSLDRAALAAYCGAYALWAEATEAIQKYGVMIKSPQGFPIQSPYLAIANRQSEIMMRIASEFGLTPASRSRIATPAESGPSLFD